jgi:hypothetical protein
MVCAYNKALPYSNSLKKMLGSGEYFSYFDDLGGNS